MNDFISRQDAINAIREAVKTYPNFYYPGLDMASRLIHDLPAADVAPGRDLRDCRNELCLRCGEYERRHLGACDGCRWEAK